MICLDTPLTLKSEDMDCARKKNNIDLIILLTITLFNI